MPSVRTLTPKDLVPGRRCRQSIYSRQGIKLVAAGITLTEGMCRTLGRSRPDELLFADSIEDLAGHIPLTAVTEPPVGDHAPADIVTSGGILALEAGQEVEPHHADAYRFGAFRGPEPKETRRARARRLKVADELIAERTESWANLPRRIERGVAPLELSEADQPGWPSLERLADFRSARVRTLHRLYGRILAGMPTSIAEPLVLVDELIDKLQRFPARFTQLGLLAPRDPEYLPDHSYSTACLCVAIATRLRWSLPDIRQAGLAGLFADVGMMLVSREVRCSDRPLTDVETNKVFRHTTVGVVLLDAIEGLPEPVRLAVYQHHERENGAGYPNAIKSAAIHDLSRVVAVADAFAAATEPRAYKRRKRPYDALEELIRLGSERLYDRVCIRALVESTGLFPVGSHVRLNTGDVAIVVGAHAQMVDRPIVSLYRRTLKGLRPDAVIDLAEIKPWELHVIQAADPPEALWPAA